VDDSAVPENFLQADVTVDAGRQTTQYLFNPRAILDYLASTKCRFVDGTFDVIKAPFTQLYSFHGFLKVGELMKQVPLVFVFMSGKRKRDYRRVLRTLKQLAPTLNPTATVMDFEAAMWRAATATAVFTQTRLFGCNFHWPQAVWRNVQELGLQAAYRDDDATHRLCRKVMALPFLPPDHVTIIGRTPGIGHRHTPASTVSVRQLHLQARKQHLECHCCVRVQQTHQNQ